MAAYKKFYIQQYTASGSTETDGTIVDTQAQFGVVCQECPFQYLPEIKELPKRDWNDEDGDDVYMPTDGLKFKAYDMEVKFLYVGTGYVKQDETVVSKEAEMKEKISGFINFIYGKNAGGSPLLKIYDEYTLTGRKGVHCISIDNELIAYDDRNNNVIGSFKAKFRVTDPATRMTYSNGKITEEQ